MNEGSGGDEGGGRDVGGVRSSVGGGSGVFGGSDGTAMAFSALFSMRSDGRYSSGLSIGITPKHTTGWIKYGCRKITDEDMCKGYHNTKWLRLLSLHSGHYQATSAVAMK